MKRTPLRRRAPLRARKSLRRTTPLERTNSMAATEAQRAAVAGQPCIACGAEHGVDAAHLLSGRRRVGACLLPACSLGGMPPRRDRRGARGRMRRRGARDRDRPRPCVSSGLPATASTRPSARAASTGTGSFSSSARRRAADRRATRDLAGRNETNQRWRDVVTSRLVCGRPPRRCGRLDRGHTRRSSWGDRSFALQARRSRSRLPPARRRGTRRRPRGDRP